MGSTSPPRLLRLLPGTERPGFVPERGRWWLLGTEMPGFVPERSLRLSTGELPASAGAGRPVFVPGQGRGRLQGTERPGFVPERGHGRLLGTERPGFVPERTPSVPRAGPEWSLSLSKGREGPVVSTGSTTAAVMGGKRVRVRSGRVGPGWVGTGREAGGLVEEAVAHAEGAVAEEGEAGVVGDDDDGLAEVVTKGEEEAMELFLGDRVKVP